MSAPSGGAAVANARKVTRYSPGMCQQFVRGIAWQVSALYPSAIDAWHGAKDRHPGDRRPPLGAPLYYSGGKFGHVVVCTQGGTNKMRSTDMPSSGVVGEGDIEWIERNWGYRYLGWTGDINGVSLPLGTDEDEMKDEDFKRIRKIVNEEVARVWTTRIDVNKPDGSETKKSTAQVIRETLQRVQKG